MSSLKTLRIQTGVVQRLNTELRYYSKEAEALKSKYELGRSKQSFEVWQDAQKVLPQVVLQLQLAYKELSFTLQKFFDSVDCSASEEATAEVAAVLLARTQLERTLDVIPSLVDVKQPVSVSLDEQEY
jgi:hypothetical protein